MATICFDAELYSRYGGLRPAAPADTGPADSPFCESAYRRCVKASNELPIPPELTLYVDGPMPGNNPAGAAKRFVSHVRTEIAIQGSLFDTDRRVERLHLGAGATAGLHPADLDALVRCIGAHFDLRGAGGTRRSATVSIADADESILATLAGLGIDRLEFAASLRSDAPAIVVDPAVAAARRAGIGQVDFALPFPEGKPRLAIFLDTLTRMLAARPDAIRLIGPAATDADRTVDPPGGDKIAAYATATERLTSAGYLLLGLDRFVQPGHQLLAARSEGTLRYDILGFGRGPATDIVALGAGSPGAINACFLVNHGDIERYCALLDEQRLPIRSGRMADADQLRRWAIVQRLVCQERLVFAELDTMLAMRWPEDFGAERDAIDTLTRDGVVRVTDAAIEVTTPGRLLLGAVARVFLGRHTAGFMREPAGC